MLVPCSENQVGIGFNRAASSRPPGLEFEKLIWSPAASRKPGDQDSAFLLGSSSPFPPSLLSLLLQPPSLGELLPLPPTPSNSSLIYKHPKRFC